MPQPFLRQAVFLRILGLSAFVLLNPGRAQQPPPADPAEVLASQLVGKLTLEEKVALCRGDGTMFINAQPKVGLVDAFWMDDGPNNVRRDVKADDFAAARPDNDPSDVSTSLPRLSELAATWNRDLALKYGQVIGEEARARGKDMMLGPGVNIVRTPVCGRDFEYMGEDPYLTSQMAVQDILGIQSRDVAASVKHFALNNQEWNRGSVDVEVDDRTLHEIYLPAFEAAVKDGHVLTVMAAYNRFRGDYCAQNDLLLNQILKKSWDFQGLVVSDWGATHDTVAAALGGLDVEMDAGKKIRYFKDPLVQAVKDGTVPMAVLDDKVRRILYVMEKIHKIDGQARFAGSINTPEHQAVAREVAEEGIVLLKNDKNLLPLDPHKIKSLLIVGSNGVKGNTRGGGSSAGEPPYEITAIDGIQKLLGDGVKVESVPLVDAKASPDKTSAAAALAEKAKGFDAVLVFTGDRMGRGAAAEGEGGDRPNLDLPPGTTETVTALLAANPNTVVINQSGAPVEMPWADQAPTLIQYWFSGMEGGTALARVVFGEVNPSGKLPVTFPKELKDSPAHALGNYNGTKVNYAEGVLVGYRWYDAKEIQPLFPFGFGLSYTTFSLANLKLSAPAIKVGDTFTASADVTNTGKRAGAEVVQLYVGDASASVPRPPHELKGFEKVLLQPGETKTVSFTLHPRDLSYWDVKTNGWKIDPGTFSILVGTGSRELPLQAEVKVGMP